MTGTPADCTEHPSLNIAPVGSSIPTTPQHVWKGRLEEVSSLCASCWLSVLRMLLAVILTPCLVLNGAPPLRRGALLRAPVAMASAPASEALDSDAAALLKEAGGDVGRAQTSCE